jgi:hypothetical protein
MELALVWYILLNLAIFGFVLLFVRAGRARVTPNERQDLEENALVGADWELVRRERCLPARCPRLMGQPPRPRKDVTCEICAATFLEVRLQRLLDGPLAPEPANPEATDNLIPEGAILTSHPCSPSLHPPLARRLEPFGLDLSASETPRWHGRRERALPPADRRWAVVRFILGIVCVAAGAAVAFFGGLLWLILPGFLIVLMGLALIASSAASGSI